MLGYELEEGRLKWEVIQPPRLRLSSEVHHCKREWEKWKPTKQRDVESSKKVFTQRAQS